MLARRRVSVVCVLALVAGLLWGLPPVPAVAAVASGETPVDSSYVPAASRAGAQLPQAQVAAPVWPSAGAATLALSGGAAALSSLDGVSVSGSGSPGGLPVSVSAPGAVSSLSQEEIEQRMMRGLPVPDAVSPVSVSAVDVTVLDQATAAALGVRGVVLSVAPSAGSAAAGSTSVQVAVGYGAFGNAFGGGYSDRLGLVSLPACALTTPDVPACRVQTPLAGGVNDKPSASVTASVTLGSPAASSSPSTASSSLSTVEDAGAGGGGMVLALSGGASSEQGNWGATSLGQAGSWQAGGSAGSFGYSIAVPVPAAPGGLTPKVSFDYSSASIDGLTKSTSQQASWIGEGWSYEPGFVERSYRPCRLDGNPSNEGDLCFVSAEPVTISLGGTSTRLIRNDADGVWKAEDDSAGWKVEHLTGLANGAHNGEAFKITTRDGTQFWFGSRDHAANGGVLSVEVFGNNPGEPCNHPSGFAYSHCPQPYRWNLDKVVDVHGNLMEYRWGTFQGSYGGNNGANVWAYDVYGWLQEIVYGGNTVTGSAHTGKVSFGINYRCFSDPLVCDDAVANSQYWMDTPWDLYCYTWVSSCGNHTPAFFSIYRLIAVRTYVWDSVMGTWSGAIEEFQTTQGFPPTGDYIPPAGDDSSPSLYMTDLWRTGYQAQYAFPGIPLDNRVDYGSNKPPMLHWRVASINTPSGEQINVAYNGDVADSSHRDCLPWENLSLIAQDHNSRRCFPQNQAGTLSWWHKYVVTDVVAHDRVGGAPDEKWHYDYSGRGTSDTALWKHDQNWNTPPSERTWSRWAGYSTVLTKHGAADGTGPQQVTEDLYFRGMDGDKTIAGGWGARDVKLDDDWDHWTIDDSEALAGQVRRSYTWDGPPNVDRTNWTSAVRHIHSITPTGSRYMQSNPTIVANRVREWQTIGQEKLAGPTYRVVLNETTFEATYGLPTSVHDYGDYAISTDDTCTTSSYTTADTTKWLIGFASQTVVTDCAATPAAANVLAASRTFYDQSTTLGATPVRGLASKTTAIKAATAYPPAAGDYLQQARATHDTFGRVLNSFDALDRQTSTAYTPANSGPTTSVAVTGPMGAGWTVTTTLDTRRGVPTRVVDVNNKATNAEYDTLGRLTKVWKNNRPVGSTPDLNYIYMVRPDLPNYVQTKTLGPDGQQISGFQLFDGMLRPRQTQAVSGTGTGRAISETVYNGIGQPAKASTYFTTGNPGDNNAALVTAADTAIDVQTRYSYDNLGRQTLIQPYTLGAPRGATFNTTFGYDGAKTVAVTPPLGATATTTIQDVQGRTVALWQHQGGTPAGAHIDTTYTYNRTGLLASVKDPALNTWSYTYDLLGRKTQTVDPDAGTSSSTYDNAGQVLSATDGRPQQLFYTYDNLGRKTTERITSATGQIQANWVYDPAGFKGQPASTSRYVAGVPTYTSAVDAYNDAYQPLSTIDTIPGFGTGGTTRIYTVTNTYKQNGDLATQHLPIVGGLPDETLTHTYKSATGLPDRVTSNYNNTVYIDANTYQYDGVFSETTYGAATGNQIKVSATYEAPTRRLLTSTFATKTSGAWANDRYKDTYTYDPAGNITTINGTKDGLADQQQCFTHDYLRRLTEAWTQTNGACTTPQRTGVDPYRRQWPNSGGYDTIGNRLRQIDKDPAGDTTWNYAIGGTDTCGAAVKPHQVRQITVTGPKAGTPTRDFCYDPAGNTTKRTTETGTTQDLHWDVEGHLQEVKQGTTTIASYTYDTAGRRLIGTETVAGITTSTLYLADGTELAKINGADPLGRRYYGTGAVRDAAGGLKWQINTHQGSDTFQIDAATNTISQPRRYLPFGEPRTTQPTGWIGTKGYINGTNGTTTGLTHLGAREYDPTTGRFTTVDPLMDLSDPTQWNPYAYAGYSPVTFSDPSGQARMNEGTDDFYFDFEGDIRSQTFGQENKDKTVLGIIKDQMCAGGIEERFCGSWYEMDPDSQKEVLFQTWCQNNPSACSKYLDAVQDEVDTTFAMMFVGIAGGTLDAMAIGLPFIEPELIAGEAWAETALISEEEAILAEVEAGEAAALVGSRVPPQTSQFLPPGITVDRHGLLTNGKYRLGSTLMEPHLNGTPGKSQFAYHVNSGKAALDAAAYADANGLWVGNKAKVFVTNGVVGFTGKGTPTSWINVYRTDKGLVHASPGNAP